MDYDVLRVTRPSRDSLRSHELVAQSWSHINRAARLVFYQQEGKRMLV